MIMFNEYELKQVCNLTVDLTKLRQNKCNHLCIENFSPKLFTTLLTKLIIVKNNKGLIRYENEQN